MAAEVQLGAKVTVGVPRVLFRLNSSHGDWDVARDGRFLIAIPYGADASAPFTVMQDFLAQLGASD
jgi:hypothetical protein